MAEKKLLRKKEKFRDEGNHQQLANACRELGDFYNQQGQYQDAIKEYQSEANIFEKLKKKLEMAKANRMLAEMYMLISEFDKALQHCDIYLKTVTALQDKVEEQRAYATIGRIHLLHGQSLADTPEGVKPLKNAEKAFIESLLICKELSGEISKIDLLDMQARLYLNIGVVKEHMTEYQESISYLEKAIKISRTNDLYELLHLCYMSASLLHHYKMKDSVVALRFCNLALDVAQLLSNRVKKECETLIVKSEILIKESDFQSAKQILHKAYKLRTPDQNDRETITKTLKVVVALCRTLDSLVTISSVDYAEKKKLYEKMGDGCCILNNFSKAVDYYLKMLECAKANNESGKNLIPIYVSLYQTYKDDKEFEEALKYLWLEYDIRKNEPDEAFHTLCSIGEICESQNKSFWTIEDVYRRAILEARKIDSKRLERIGMGRLLKVQQKFNMQNSVDALREDAKASGIDLDAEDELEEEEQSEHNTPDVGDEICLEDLTDSQSENEEIATTSERSRVLRKRNTTGISVKRNKKGETHLHQACIAGNYNLVKLLIEQGHVINVRDHAGWLPLHEACNYGYKAIVELLLDNGASINDKGGTECSGITPLYDACSNGSLDVIELLLERGANATIKTDSGDTPLNILEKWRESVQLDIFKKSQYERIQQKLDEQLKRAGISTPSKSYSSRNNSTNNSASSLNNSSLRLLAYEKSDSDEGDDASIVRLRPTNDSCSVSASNVLRDSNKRTANANREISARKEYQNVMETLKHPNRIHTSTTVDDEHHSRKRSGFLDPDEVDDDCWLDNDLRPENKKRRFVTDRIFNSIQNPERPKVDSSKNVSISLPERRLSNRIVDDDDSEIDEIFIINDNEEANDSNDAFKVLFDTNRRKFPARKPSTVGSRGLSLSSDRKPKSSKNQQTLLLNRGFSRFKSNSMLYNDDSNEMSTEPDSTTQSTAETVTFRRNDIPEATAIPPVPSKVAPTVSFKIKVEDELLLVPVDRKKVDEANIRWLAEEASRRYYNLSGLKPILRLMTADGFAFEENDLISAALNESMISSKVLEFKNSPLALRYEEICGQFGQEFDSTVKTVLEKADASNSLNLENFALTPDIAQPIFTALMHQTTLRILDLSNNFFQDEGCKQLGKSLATLKQLQILNLSGNCITAEGLNHFRFTTTNSLPLEDLSMSFNPLGNTSIRSLEMFVKNAPKLRKLVLSSCNITNFYDFDLNFFNLIDFDVSFNTISYESLRTVLSKLNVCRLQNLNLGFVLRDLRCSSMINEFLESGTCEKFKAINLSGCQIIDSDIYGIVQNLSKAKNLEILKLIQNVKLTTLSLQYLMEYCPHVKRIYLQQCPLIVNAQRLTEIHLNSNEIFPELIVLSLSDNNYEDDQLEILTGFWKSRWRNRAKVEIFKDYVYLFVNDNDFIRNIE